MLMGQEACFSCTNMRTCASCLVGLFASPSSPLLLPVQVGLLASSSSPLFPLFAYCARTETFVTTAVAPSRSRDCNRALKRPSEIVNIIIARRTPPFTIAASASVAAAGSTAAAAVRKAALEPSRRSRRLWPPPHPRCRARQQRRDAPWAPCATCTAATPAAAGPAPRVA